MVKRPLQRYEDSTVGLAVKAWLERTGIDPNMVVGWKINQRVGDLSQIELTMYFDDAPVPPPPPVDGGGIGVSIDVNWDRPRRHTTCAEVTPYPGAPKEYVCTEGCPVNEDARVIKIDREE